MLYADVILPLAIPQAYSYSVPSALEHEVAIGKRVVVQLGERKQYSAVICRLHSDVPNSTRVKPILAVLDQEPVVLETQLKFWHWMAGYYLCTGGEVYKAALPSGLKLESESVICLASDFTADYTLSPAEDLVIKLLQKNHQQSVKDISTALGKESTALRVIKTMVEKELVVVSEKLSETAQPRKEKYIQLASEFDSFEKVQGLYHTINRAPKQVTLLTSYIHLAAMDEQHGPVPVSCASIQLASGIGTSVINAMVQKGIFEILHKKKEDPDLYSGQPVTLKELSVAQEISYREIKAQFMEKDTILFHGITSSGKTEVYMHLIAGLLEQGKQILYLLPEIALTTQMITRLRRVFGNRVGVYHSRFSDRERVRLWKQLLHGSKGNAPGLIIGARSSVFLPFRDLGLVIIDEEQETSYKQSDPAPRYHARDAAIMLAHLHGAKVLMGTATPSIESFSNGRQKKYGLVSLDERYGQVQLPEVRIIDMTDAMKSKRMTGHYSHALLKKLQETIASGEQAILFQNRRGFSLYFQCHECGWVPVCKHCDVSLTYHKSDNDLVCHYCGYRHRPYNACASCGSADLRTHGFGTEKVVDDLKVLLPDARIARLDLDTATSRKAYETLLMDFDNQRYDILVGTQMVTKGLDFDNVTLVGILNADNLLNFPDFRAFERSYQMMAQVSGRAGRKQKRGLVLIQTWSPKHAILRRVLKNDYLGMYESEMAERKKYKYPPFVRLIRLTLRHKNNSVLDAAAAKILAELHTFKGIDALGPEIPLVSRVRNENIRNILVKIPRDPSLQETKSLLMILVRKYQQMPEYKALQVIADVDPL
jgi:primosomal protein N' (replication factor Y) (superfamily II helicase)